MSFITDFFKQRGWLGIVQQNPTTGSLEVAGATINGLPLYTWDTKPLPWDVELGAEIYIDMSSFTGDHVYPVPVKAITDGARWRPVGGKQITHYVHGSAAAPAYTIGATNPAVETVFTTVSPGFPADFFFVGSGLLIEADFLKTGSGTTIDAASVFNVRFGKNNTNSDGLVFTQTSSTALLRQHNCTTEAVVTTAGTATNAVFTTKPTLKNSAVTDLVKDRASVLDTTAVNYVRPSVTPGDITDTHALLFLRISWIG